MQTATINWVFFFFCFLQLSTSLTSRCVRVSVRVPVRVHLSTKSMRAYVNAFERRPVAAFLSLYDILSLWNSNGMQYNDRWQILFSRLPSLLLFVSCRIVIWFWCRILSDRISFWPTHFSCITSLCLRLNYKLYLFDVKFIIIFHWSRFLLSHIIMHAIARNRRLNARMNAKNRQKIIFVALGEIPSFVYVFGWNQLSDTDTNKKKKAQPNRFVVAAKWKPIQARCAMNAIHFPVRWHNFTVDFECVASMRHFVLFERNGSGLGETLTHKIMTNKSGRMRGVDFTCIWIAINSHRNAWLRRIYSH